ncbi:MAG: response regulator transcription factor [Micrococcales bacterium]|nr:response regulator transcription factor [Micrococcales bacterium]
MTEPRAIRIVLVDDHHMFRTGVRAELTSSASAAAYGSHRDGTSTRSTPRPPAPALEIVGEAGAVESATAVITETRPDVVLLDVHIPGGNGRGGADVIRACATVKTGSGAPVRFLALSVSDAAEDVIAVIRAGARGYVTKTINAAELLTAITRVADGDAVFSPRLAGFVLDAFGAAAGEVAEIDEELDRLSAREREVMRLIARGYQYKEVAKELFISIKTVETHVSSVLRKLQLSSRHELTAWAMGRRLL